MLPLLSDSKGSGSILLPFFICSESDRRKLGDPKIGAAVWNERQRLHLCRQEAFGINRAGRCVARPAVTQTPANRSSLNRGTDWCAFG
jgi:hypothetical protein